MNCNNNRESKMVFNEIGIVVLCGRNKHLLEGSFGIRNFHLTRIILWPRRCHCTRQSLVNGCSRHSPVLRPACCLLIPEVSDAVLCSPLWSCRSIVSFVFTSFWFHVYGLLSRCIRPMLFWRYR